MHLNDLLNNICQIEHGFKHILAAEKEISNSYTIEERYNFALNLFQSKEYQQRMLAVTILGNIAHCNSSAYLFLKQEVPQDKNWKVQEMLAMAFDCYCKKKGYEESLPIIEEWLNSNHPNIIRAVTEGLRIWTSRPFFKDYPNIAITLIAQNKYHPSEYVRKSIGNALKDISKKHKELILNEIETWDLSQPKIELVYKHATKFIL